MVKDSFISKKIKPTLRHALNAIENPQEERQNIILGVGTNDIRDNRSLEYIRHTLHQIITAIEASYPNATLYICGVPLSAALDINNIIQVNDTYQGLCSSKS